MRRVRRNQVDHRTACRRLKQIGTCLRHRKLFELTEPHMSQFYNTIIFEIMRSKGFEEIKMNQNDPLNEVWMGKKSTKTKAERVVAEKMQWVDSMN